MPKRNFNRNAILAAIAIPSLGMSLFALALIGQIRGLMEASRWVAHSNEVIAQAYYVEKLVIDLQVGLRGYVLSRKNQNYLEPYSQAKFQLREALPKFEGMVADNPEQLKRAAGLVQSARAWEEYAARTLKEIETKGTISLESSDRGKALIDAMRFGFDEFIDLEEKLRDRRIARSSRSASIVVLLGSGLTLVLGAIAATISCNLLKKVEQNYKDLSKTAIEARNFLNKERDEAIQRLEQSNLDLESYAHTVSHDLRSPLRTIAMFADLLLSMLGDEQLLMYANNIAVRARDMDELITDILDYSSLTIGDKEPEPIRLDSIFEEVIFRLNLEISESKADISVPKSLPAVWGYRKLLLQAIFNLLVNAIKFVSKGVVPLITIRAEDRGEKVRIWIEDNGIGIEPKNRERVWIVFERLHTREAYPGTGIGLAIVKKSIEQMGGQVGVEGELGKGSRFWIELQKA